MAKVSGPLYSAEARGRIADIMVHFPWKGRACVRQWLKPTNPNSTDQQAVRSYLKAMAKSMYFANRTTLKGDGDATTDKVQLKVLTPSTQIWNAFLVDNGVGDLSANWLAAETAWSALDPTAQDAWDTAADDLVPVIPAVTHGVEVYTSGEVFFHYRDALYKAGVDTAAPDATPPTYA